MQLSKLKPAPWMTIGVIVVKHAKKQRAKSTGCSHSQCLCRVEVGEPSVSGACFLLLSFLLETGRPLNIVLINSLRAAGDATFPVVMGVFSMVAMSLPLGYFLVFHLELGLAGIWLAIAADEWTRAVIMFFRWRSRKWENYSLVEGKGAGQQSLIRNENAG